MESIILKRKIERIFEKLDSMNESLSVENSSELLRGFEDGINEGIGSFFGKLAGKAKGAFDTMVSKGKSFYEKGKELAGEAWTAIKNFTTKLINDVKVGFDKAVSYVVDNYKSFVETLKTTYKNAVNEINNAYESMKNKAEAFAESVKGVFTDILEQSTLMIENIKAKFEAGKDKMAAWFEKNKAEIEAQVVAAKASGVEKMKLFGEKVSVFMKDSAEVSKNIGLVAVFVAVAPIVYVVQGVKAIPSAYEALSKTLSEYIAKETNDFKSAYSGELKKESFKHILTFEKFNYK